MIKLSVHSLPINQNAHFQAKYSWPEWPRCFKTGSDARQRIPCLWPNKQSHDMSNLLCSSLFFTIMLGNQTRLRTLKYLSVLIIQKRIDHFGWYRKYHFGWYRNNLIRETNTGSLRVRNPGCSCICAFTNMVKPIVVGKRMSFEFFSSGKCSPQPEFNETVYVG